MRWVFYIAGSLLILYSAFEVGKGIYHGIEDNAYWRGRQEAEKRCYDAHAKKLQEMK